MEAKKSFPCYTIPFHIFSKTCYLRTEFNSSRLSGNFLILYTVHCMLELICLFFWIIKTFPFEKDILLNILFITFGSQIFSQLPVLSLCFIFSLTERTMGCLGKLPHLRILFYIQLFCCHFEERKGPMTIVMTAGVSFYVMPALFFS